MQKKAIALKKRIAWIDVAKGLAILLVIAGHSLGYNSLICKIIYSFHMPLFFILSGYNLKPAENLSDLSQRTKKDFKRLVVPTVIILAITGILNVLLGYSNPMKELGDFACKIFWANGSSVMDGMPAMGLPWFLISLFFAKLILRLLSILLKDDFELIGFMLGFAGIALVKRLIILPFGCNLALISMMFVALGIIARKTSSFLSRYRTILFVMCIFFATFIIDRYDIFSIAAYSFNLHTVMGAFASTFSVCVLCRILSSNKMFRKTLSSIGANTMPIFFVHCFDSYFSFLYNSENRYIFTILRIFWVLLFAWVLISIPKWIKKYS